MKIFNILNNKFSYTFAVLAFTIPSGWIAAVYGYYFFISSSGILDHHLIFSLGFLMFAASVIHSIHFGWLERFGAPSFYKEGSYINKLLKDNYFLKNSNDLSDGELIRLYNALTKFSNHNGKFAFIYSFFVVVIFTLSSDFLGRDISTLIYLAAGGLISSLFYGFYAVMITEVITLNVRTKVNELLYLRGVSSHYRHRSFAYYNLIAGIILVASMVVVALFAHSPHRSFEAITFFILITFIALEIFNFSSSIQIKRSYAALNKATRQLTGGGKGTLFVDFRVKELNEFAESYNKAAEELYTVKKSLEETVKIRTEEIEKQKEELAALNRSKDKLFSIIAHDLRNSFSALLGISRILLEDFETINDKDKLVLINEISKATGKSYHLLENLLSWANFQGGNLKSDFETLKLREIADECAGLQNTAADKKNIRIINNISSGARLFADKFMLSSVVRNLINNAVKFTGVNGQVTISYYEYKDYTELTVEDTGAGIPQAAIQKILGKYNEYYTTPGTDGEVGSGLGLRMCKEFIEKMNGIMLIESKLNAGTKIALRFPKERI